MPRNLTWGAVSIGWPPKDSLSSSGALREKEIALVFSWEKLKPHSSDHELIESRDFWRILQDAFRDPLECQIAMSSAKMDC